MYNVCIYMGMYGGVWGYMYVLYVYICMGVNGVVLCGERVRVYLVSGVCGGIFIGVYMYVRLQS